MVHQLPEVTMLRFFHSLFPVLLPVAVLTGCGPASYRDIRPEHWTWWGADPEKVESVLERVRSGGGNGEYWDTGNPFGPGDWTWEFNQVAEQEWQRAGQLELDGKLIAASQAYDQASVYFGLAKYPHIARTEAENTALDRQLAAYRKSFELSGYGYRVVHATLDESRVTGLLHLPQPERHPAPYPLVIGTNGLDVFAAESGPLVRDLLNRGIAVLMSDIPGTGLNSAVPLRPDFERLWLVFLDHLQRDPTLDVTRVGAFGMSFGGNAAVKLAMTREQDFLAIANICGPVHEVFTLSPAQVGAIEAMYLDGLVDRLHLPDTEPTTIVAAARGFSLVSQGLIGQGQRTRVPILSLNAREDYVAPEQDLQLVTEASQAGRLVWSGANNHCPQYRERDMPLVAAFFDTYLKSTASTGRQNSGGSSPSKVDPQ